MEQEVIQVPHNFTPRDYQLEVFKALDSGTKRVFMKWPRRHGKDKVCWTYLVKAAATTPGNYYYVFPYKTDARRALWENIDKSGFRTLDHLHPSLIKSKRNQDMVIELTNGSFIQFLGLDEPDKIRGVAAKGVIFSEFAYQPADGYKIFSPVLRESGGWAIFQSTPQGRNHFYEMDMRIRNSKNWFYSSFQCLWPDRDDYNGDYMPIEELNLIQEEEGFSDEEMATEYGVSYAAGVKGAFYMNHIEKAREDNRIGCFPVDDHKYVDTFWDLGVSDSTSVWFRQIHEGKTVWVDYFEESGKDVAFYVDMLKRKGYNYRTHYLPHDGRNTSIQTGMSTADKFRDVCREAGVSSDVVACTKDRNIQDGINRVRAAFSRYYFNIGTTADGVEKLGLYHRRYDKNRQVFLKEPVHDWTSHCADALRTSVAREVSEQDNPLFNFGDIEAITEFDVFDY